jgi:hypothetical protein
MSRLRSELLVKRSHGEGQRGLGILELLSICTAGHHTEVTSSRHSKLGGCSFIDSERRAHTAAAIGQCA